MTLSLAMTAGLLVAGSALADRDDRSSGDRERGDHRATHVSAFGTVIDHSGHYVLTADLNAGTAPGPAVIILSSDVHLDLDGHSIVGNGNINDGSNFGIWVAGTASAPLSNVRVSNGSVSKTHFGVWLDYTTQSRVAEMTFIGNRGGIGLSHSSGNALTENTAIGQSVYGIYAAGVSGNNRIIGNICSTNTFGIYVTGGSSGNKIQENELNYNRNVGLWVFAGDNNVVRENECSNNGNPSFGAGILLGVPAAFNRGVPLFVHGTVVMENVALGQNKAIGIGGGRYYADLYDTSIDNGACDNSWKENFFEKDNETGTDSGPGVGCIQ